MRALPVFLLVSALGLSAVGKEAKEAKEAMEYHEVVEKQLQSADGFIFTNNYVHKWVTFPSAEGVSLEGTKVTLSPIKGVATVEFFVASWCIPCQEMMSDLKNLEKRYSKFNVRFFYVFSHDHKDDVRGFVKEYELKDNVVLATHEMLKAFHNPGLPSIYVSDRDTFLLTRFLNARQPKIKDLDRILFHLAAN